MKYEPTKKFQKELSREDVKTYNYYLTVGDLKKFLEHHKLPDDAPVLIQRVEDFYYEKNNWGVHLKKGEFYNQCVHWNERVDSGEFEDREQYPRMNEETRKAKYSEEDLNFMKEQYTPAWCCVKYSDEDEMLFIDLHY